MQIVVLGPHRSGTSLVTRLINMMGAYFDAGNASIGFNDENPKGFWERSDVIKCDEDILKHYNSSWDRLDNWKFAAPKKTPKDLEEVATKMKNIILEMDGHRPWVMKDPRMCLTFPFWKTLLEVPVLVVVYRDPVEVAVSLRQRNGFALSQGLAMWEYYAVGIANAIGDLPVAFVSHSDMLTNPIGMMQKLFDRLKELGVREISLPSEREITAFIEPSLYRSKADELPHSEVLTDFQKELVAYLKGEKKLDGKTLKPSQFAADTMKNADSAGKLRAQLSETNQKFAAVDQQRNELQSELEVIKPTYEDKLVRMQHEIERLQYQLGTTQESVSWKVGNGIVRFAKKLTLQS
ncbi:MAG: sulfotransferase [Rickettsiales bacterium]